MTLCPHGREMNTDQSMIFNLTGPVYTCSCCHAHWGGYEGDPNITRFCGTCSGPELTESRWVNTLEPPPGRAEEIRAAHEQRKKFGAPHEPRGTATSSHQRFSALPGISIGDYYTIMTDVDPPAPWWKRLWRYVWNS